MRLKRPYRYAILVAPMLLYLVYALYPAGHPTDGQIINRKPPPADYGFLARKLRTLFNLQEVAEGTRSGFALDLRHNDLTDLDLSQQAAFLLNYASFDSRTRWPAPRNMPVDYSPQTVNELGKNPGLGVRHLHQMGIDGRGVSIGIVDKSLLREHNEYAARIRLYEEIRPLDEFQRQASMHGCAVTSIAVGRTVGVAPRAEVYYVGASCRKRARLGIGGKGRDFRWYARAVHRLVEISRTLPREKRIRVISLSIGWSPQETGYADMTEAVRKAQEDGILVVSSSIGEYRGLYFQGLGRSPLTDPDDPNSYEPGSWLIDSFRKTDGRTRPNTILVPMDSRTTAAPNGPGDYVFYREGGWSWSIPYIAGLYALAVQVRSDIEPERFWQIAADTGTHITWTDSQGKMFPLGPIVNPVRLIEELRADRR